MEARLEARMDRPPPILQPIEGILKRERDDPTDANQSPTKKAKETD